MYLNNILGNNNGMDPFNNLQQQGQQAMQSGMQAQNALMQKRGSAMQDAVQAFQQQEAEKQARAQQALSLGLTLATGGLGGAGTAAGEATAGEAAAAGAAEAAAAGAAEAGNIFSSLPAQQFRAQSFADAAKAAGSSFQPNFDFTKKPWMFY